MARQQPNDTQAKIAAAPKFAPVDMDKFWAEHLRRMGDPAYAAAHKAQKMKEALERDETILREAARIRAWRKDFGRLPVEPRHDAFLLSFD